MSRNISVWVSFVLLSPFLMVAGAVECSENETLVKWKPSTMKRPTECLMQCSSMTFDKKLLLQDNRNIQMIDSTEDALGEYCWSTKLKCVTGETFLQAYVVLPVDLTAVGHEQLEVRTTDTVATTLQVHSSPTTLEDSCGLRYEVTSHFSTPNAKASFCVQLVTQEDDLGDKVLKCPPHLVTFWQRNSNQSSQQGGG